MPDDERDDETRRRIRDRECDLAAALEKERTRPVPPRPGAAPVRLAAGFGAR